MKTTPAALVAHMSTGTTTLAYLISITRTDGVVIAVTDHDQDITYPPVSGTIYKASLGMDASAILATANMSVDNLEVTGFLSVLGVSEASLAAGVWDYAEARIIRVNWADLSMGDEKMKRGWLGEISSGGDKFVSEIRGLTQKLQGAIGEIFSPSCKADLFDSRCKIVATEGVWKFSGKTVDAIVTAQRQFTDAGLVQLAGFFTAGKLEWTSGANTGLAKEIKIHLGGGNITLQEPMPYTIAIGDTYTIYAGCQKRYAEDCVAKFANGINFRGFPTIPGNDAVLRGP